MMTAPDLFHLKGENSDTLDSDSCLHSDGFAVKLTRVKILLAFVLPLKIFSTLDQRRRLLFIHDTCLGDSYEESFCRN